MPRSLAETMDPEWAVALEPVSPNISAMGDFLRAEVAVGRTYLPAGGNVLRAFQAPMSQVKVLVVGQDPYPTPGHAIGLAFAVDKAVRPVPRSLANIYKELRSDLGILPPPHGDLTKWTESGVLLLNRVLTVAPGAPASHRGMGWEAVTGQAITALVARGGPLVAILWGKDAQTLIPVLSGVPFVASTHPSPMSADRGFFGSKPFSRANALLVEQGAEPVDWTLA